MARIYPCPACDGDGFVIEACGCREAMCPHVSPFDNGIEPRPGAYFKFWVRRTDGSSGKGGKHEACDFLVLDWVHDPFAIPAAMAYADACEATHPELAADIRKRAEKAKNAEVPAA